MSKNLIFRSQDSTKNGNDYLSRALVRESGRLILDINGNPQAWPADMVEEPFEYVVAAVNPPTLRNKAMHYILNTGVGTPAVAISLTGGLKLTTTTAFTDGTTADTTNLKATTASPFATRGVVYSNNSRLRFQTQINIVALTNQVIIGLCQAPHATLLDVSNQGTDSVLFAFDPLNALSSGITTYATNWIAISKAASGTPLYYDTGVPVIAGADVELAVEFTAALVPTFYINGVLVATAAAAWTVLVALLAMIGIKTTTAAAKVMHVRYTRIARAIG